MNVESTQRPNAHDARFADARRVLEEAIAARAFPGCAYGVLAAGEILLEDALGCFTYEDHSPEVAPNTVFDLASVTKVVATTAVAMILHQRGQLDLDTPLGDLLPAFLTGRPIEDRARRVTVRHLLAHSSGLPGYVEFFRTLRTPSDLISACLQLPLEADPGARAEYSDPGFILLGKALEVCAGEELRVSAHREIFAPLGMAATCFSPPRMDRALIPPTEKDTTLRHRRIQGEVQDENAWLLNGVAGHAGLFSNVPDLLRLSSALLDSGFGRIDSAATSNLFRAATVELFAQRQQPEGSCRAIGWDTPSPSSSSGRYFSRHSIGHLGFSGCSLWIDLDAGIAVALLTNRTWPDRKSQLIREVRPAFHDAMRRAL
jgi:CubicO group peptidase (beta-lactamase class C family)